MSQLYLAEFYLYVIVIKLAGASYSMAKFYHAVNQLVQTSIYFAIGKLIFGKIFEERELLNVQIANAINEVAI